MNELVVGSTAIKFYFPEFNRNPKDLDVAYSSKSLRMVNKKGVEYLENPILIDWVKEKYTFKKYCPPDELLTLKISHLFWDLENKSWNKHISDVIFLCEKGAKFIPVLFWDLYEYWNTVHGKRKSSDLSMTSKQFFNNAIKCPYEHDYIHTILIQHEHFKGQPLPTYTKILKEGQEVDVCMKKFNLLTEEEKFNIVFEEVAVMAWEGRFPKNMYWVEKYHRMLKKFVISHCKVEEGIWILLNYKKLLHSPFNFEEFLNNKLNVK